MHSSVLTSARAGILLALLAVSLLIPAAMPHGILLKTILIPVAAAAFAGYALRHRGAWMQILRDWGMRPLYETILVRLLAVWSGGFFLAMLLFPKHPTAFAVLTAAGTAGLFFAAGRRIPLPADRDFRTRLTVLVSLALIYLGWSFAIPYHFSTAPDETVRFAISEYLARHRMCIPRGDDPELLQAIGGWYGYSYAFYPHVPQFVGGLLLWPLQHIVPHEYWHLLGRLPSVLAGIGAVWMAFRIAARLLPVRARLISVLIFGCWPQFVYVASYSNNDCWALFCTMVIFDAMAAALQARRWTTPIALELGVGIGCCLLSYYNAYPAILAAFFCYLCCHNRVTERDFWRHGILIAAVALGIAGWWFLRNYRLYDGDFLAMSAVNSTSEQHALEWVKPTKRNVFEPTSLWDFATSGWLRATVTTFYCWVLQLPVLPRLWQWAVRFAMLGTAITWGVLLLRTPMRRRLAAKKARLPEILWEIAPFLVLEFVLVALLHFSYSHCFDYQPQGRYLLPGLGVVTLGLTLMLRLGETVLPCRVRLLSRLLLPAGAGAVMATMLYITWILVSHYAVWCA